MIAADESVFPNNAVELLAIRLGLIDPEIFVARRPLRETDPVQSIGVFAALWTPMQESSEMRGRVAPSAQEPTLSRYVITVQAFVKDGDEERGLAAHSVLSMLIRSILYRDAALRLGLSSLETDVLDVRERATRWGITAQRYVNNELRSEWLYLSSIELWLETETY